MKKIVKKSKNKPASKTKMQKKKELRNKTKILSKVEKTNQDEATEENNIENKSEEVISIKKLIRSIFNVRESKRQLSFLGIDLKTTSLKINEKLFESCFKKLAEIDKLINDKNLDHKTKKDKFFDLTKEYYKLLPHSFPYPDYGMYLINDIDKIQREICLLELIRSYNELDIKFQKIKNKIKELNLKEENELNNSISLNDSINMSINNIENISEVDQSRRNIISDAFFEQALSQFDYNITLLDKNSDDFQEIDGYLNLYSTDKGGPYPPLILEELFQLEKKNKENKAKNTFYWFGCEIIHFYSILRHGFRRPDKEAPKNAFIYGKGILLSQNAYSQIQKCLPKNNIVYLFVCSVNDMSAKTVHLHHKNYPEQLKENFNSIKIKKKIVIPPENEDSEEASSEDMPYIDSDDYIIYRPSLIQIHYIAKVEIP